VELIKYIREELPYGRGILKTHAGEPQSLSDITKTKYFGKEDNFDKTDKPLDIMS